MKSTMWNMVIFSCAKCNSSGSEIQEIAYWEETDGENTK